MRNFCHFLICHNAHNYQLFKNNTTAECYHKLSDFDSIACALLMEALLQDCSVKDAIKSCVVNKHLLPWKIGSCLLFIWSACGRMEHIMEYTV